MVLTRHKGTWREETCSMDGCEKLCYNRQFMLCEMHYTRQRKGSPPMHWAPQCSNRHKRTGEPKVCKQPGCSRPSVKLNWCHTHYNRDMFDRDMDVPIPYRKPYKKRKPK